MKFKYLLETQNEWFFIMSINDLAEQMCKSVRSINYYISKGQIKLETVNLTLTNIYDQYGEYSLLPSGLLKVTKKP